MQYAVTRGEKGKIEVKVDVPKAAFDQTYKSTLDSHVKSADIAGFRPGMAPVDIVEKHVGISKVLNETASFLVNKHLSEIFEKEKFFPIDSPKIAIETLSAGAPFSFTVSFTQKPKVTVGDWKTLKVKKVAAREITENDVEESVKNIFEAWKKSKETKEPERPEGPEGPKEESGKFIYDAHGNRIPVKEETKVDDNFAKAIGARDLSHLRELVKKDLETIVADQVEAKLEQEIFDKVLEISSVEIPDILIEDELNRLLVRLTSQLEQQKRDLDSYLAEQKTTIDGLKAKWRPQALKNVKTTLVMDEIGRQEAVTVTKEEIEQGMRGVTETNLSSDQKADLERYIALSIYQAKTLDLVKKAIRAV
ncbi:hypothetical protein HYZ70_03805 [Candidatus Curtissbacteria bacterium]|nr:hypothetical protein [Candidatus Curtissbacteria bacterium]